MTHRPYSLESFGNLFDGLGGLWNTLDRFHFLLAHGRQNRGNNGPDDGDDDGGPRQAGEIGDPDPRRERERNRITI